MNKSWSNYDSDWFVSLNSTATDIVVIILVRNRQMTSLTKPARIAGISRQGWRVVYSQNGKWQPICPWCAAQGPCGLPDMDRHERWRDHSGLPISEGIPFGLFPPYDLSGVRWQVLIRGAALSCYCRLTQNRNRHAPNHKEHAGEFNQPLMTATGDSAVTVFTRSDWLVSMSGLCSQSENIFSVCSRWLHYERHPPPFVLWKKVR